jgi:hypothetical protein
MEKPNIGLILPKQFKEEPGAFVANSIVGHKSVSAYDINYLFPLYLYPAEKRSPKRASSTIMMIFDPGSEYAAKKPNVSAVVIERLNERYKKVPSPEQVFLAQPASSWVYTRYSG